MSDNLSLRQNQEGVLLIMALVVTMVVLTIALITSTIAIREQRVSTIADKGQNALYASETAAENAIFQIRTLGVDPIQLSGSGVLSNGAEWERTVKTTTDEFVFDFIPAGGEEEADLYNRENENAAAAVSSVTMSWSSGNEVTVDVFEWDGEQLTGPVSTRYPCGIVPCSVQLNFDPNKAYALTLRATGTAVTDLILSIATPQGQPQVPTTITVTGEFEGVKQGLELILPEPAPWEG